MSSVSGLSPQHRANARNRAVDAALLALRHAPEIHYTQDARRWEGINKGLRSSRKQFPRYIDCSGFFSWCLWNALAVPYRVRDVVNGANWQAGYTGTMLRHGKEVQHFDNWMRGDAIIYGVPGSTGAHTALYIGGGLVISHGSEGGPYKLAWDYRGDRMSTRRYI